MPPDLVQAWSLMTAARKAGRRFFAFYNCACLGTTFIRGLIVHSLAGGDLSGASQPHKHIQLMPIDEDGPPIDKLARSVHLEGQGRFRLNM